MNDNSAGQHKKNAAQHEQEAAGHAEKAAQHELAAATAATVAAEHEQEAERALNQTKAHEHEALLLLEQTQTNEQETHELRQEVFQRLALAKARERRAKLSLVPLAVLEQEGELPLGATDVREREARQGLEEAKAPEPEITKDPGPAVSEPEPMPSAPPGQPMRRVW